MSEELRKGPSHSGTESAWTVEARSCINRPIACGDLLLGTEWTQVPFNRATVGVPNGGLLFQGADLGMLTYPAAEALRWWFLADLAAAYKDTGVETRLVEYKVVFSKTATPVRAMNQCDSRGRAAAAIPSQNRGVE
ncbi:hypothetical protein [uncultured Variovorax sp.]|uniref:hypothetical protein n=1 Tax=uncultured Variovorax sp. TaxID=114708 RepID=UPI0025E48B54|nr:hypothetical protein [uncultured Variovorax sp.]